MMAERGFAIRHWSGTFLVEVRPLAGGDMAGRAETERALSTLLFDYRHHDSTIASSIETLHQRLFSPGLLHRPPGVSAVRALRSARSNASAATCKRLLAWAGCRSDTSNARRRSHEGARAGSSRPYSGPQRKPRPPFSKPPSWTKWVSPSPAWM
jgi:hypothetical protein